jgi:uncharacterized protein (DUF302 family)
MFERDPRAGLYAPLRASIYAAHDGATWFAYDQPSSLLGSLDDQGIAAVAEILDGKMERLAALIAG